MFVTKPIVAHFEVLSVHIRLETIACALKGHKNFCQFSNSNTRIFASKDGMSFRKKSKR